MRCTHCGTENPASADRCANCGEWLDTPAETIAPAAPDDDETRAPGLAQPSRPTAPPRSAAAPATAAGGDPAGAGGLTVGQNFGTRYHIIKRLGAGGMGAVYQAWDSELGVAVALKVIRPDVAADPAAARDLDRRFKRELLLARQVTHRNVVRIHDLGEIDGIKYISMPYIDGTDLGSVLRETGRLPIPRALRLAREIAAGLQAAHDADVVHRDLKPENIMIDADDRALIMDFGISRSGAVGATATMAGAVVGTVQYMSPEQGRGQQADRRSDIYSFGLIVYDMLTGRRRGASAESAVAELMGRMQKAPPPVRTLEPAVPEALERIVSKCLEPDPDKRYQRTADLVAELDALDAEGHPRRRRPVSRMRWPLMTGALVLVLGLVAVAWWYGRRSTPRTSAPHAPVSVLVADFQNRTGDAVFDGLISQALTVGVEGASFISAYPRRDAVRLAAQLTPEKVLDAKAASLIALREGIGVVIEGSISRQGHDYLLDVQALNPVNGHTLLSSKTTADGREQVLPAVGRAATQVRRALGDAGVIDSQAAAETFTAGSLEAAHEYATAQELNWKGDFDQAVQHYKEAIADDPSMGRAYAGLAALYANLGRTDEAEAEYRIALSKLDRMTERERYRTRGGYYLLMRNTDRAIDEFEALVKQYPADSAGLANLAFAYFYRRDMKRALADGRRAMRIYPKNVISRDNVALYAMYAGDFKTAEREAADVLKLNPKYVKAYVATGLSQLATGQPAEAAATYHTLDGVSPAGHIFATYGLIDLALYEGRLNDAAKRAQQALAAPNLPKSVATRLEATLAETRTLQGRSAEAVQAADKAAASSDEGTLFLAGRAYLTAGLGARVQTIANSLERHLATDPQIYGHLLEGEMALRAGRAREALDAFQAAQKLADTWLGRFDMARAYLAAGAFTEASSELDRCTARKGEATAVFLDDIPSFHLFAPVAYYRGRIQEGLKSSAAAASYKAFLAIKAHGDQQTLVANARRRLTALGATGRP